MADAAVIVRLLTWLSPAFPTGAFAYSHGLEWAVAAGDVSDTGSLRAWLEDLLRLGAGRSDAILLRHAHRAAAEGHVIAGRPLPRGEDPVVDPAIQGCPGLRPGMTSVNEDQPGTALDTIADLAAAAAPSRERQAETLGLGAAFATAAAPWGRVAPAAYPVAVGALTGRSGVPEDDATVAYLQAFTANLVSAAVRLIPLGQTAGLAVLAALEPAILAVLGETTGAGLADIGGACWRSDIASMRHETQYTRLFRT